MLNYLSKSIIPIIFLLIITYGMFKGRKVYEWFIEGAKDGLKVCLRIFPYLLAMIIAVQIFREAKLMDLLNNLIAPLGNMIGLPKELIPLIIIKPLSGSGAIGVFTDIIKNFGPDTKIGLIASVVMGTTETIFYTITVYFGAVKVKKIRHTLWAAIMADITAIIMAVLVVNLFIMK
ncbi:spore maturation protein [Clostridium saccharobutylicum]|uniref:Spore maturation protein B n=1 Tax=Clostridium saccharobutylicum DSM 13864 TaxID=1345695 RepID=U5MN74_CLOSA|nr:nucleoside recognition domain-containing protein [Clostridium saccharobutylicum]AGX41141.1 spore maturation protein B [Clostridium saccharobutylicum DSM 13864]AQR88426.1 spore maturation protein B [Clostridium saccharobutylicum]AQR98324.1 spore maturation protein B [Clostridium saccharobutylicum]AQS08033.1 spore maturation protein B [Clostridium saccharobutylicum]AQS12314.1 spore maturation protein B [Clostridium saccharobutylicum]